MRRFFALCSICILLIGTWMPSTAVAEVCSIKRAFFAPPSGFDGGIRIGADGKPSKKIVILTNGDDCAGKEIKFSIISDITNQPLKNYTERAIVLADNQGARVDLYLEEEQCRADQLRRLWDNIKTSGKFDEYKQKWYEGPTATAETKIVWLTMAQYNTESQYVFFQYVNDIGNAVQNALADVVSAGINVTLGAANLISGIFTDYKDRPEIATRIAANTLAGQYLVSEFGDYDCRYHIAVTQPYVSGSGDAPTWIPFDSQQDLERTLSFMCNQERPFEKRWWEQGIAVNMNDFQGSCAEDVVWSDRFDGVSVGSDVQIDKTDACLDSQDNRIPDCYEVLAPIPGIGDVIYFEGNTSLPEDQRSKPFALETLFRTGIDIAIGAVSLVAVLALMYVGFQYMQSKNVGDVSKLMVTRERLLGVFAGIAVILGIYVILNTINPELLKLAPTLDPVTLVEATADNTTPGELVQDLRRTVPNSGKGYALDGTYDKPIASNASIQSIHTTLSAGTATIQRIEVDVGSGSDTNGMIHFRLSNGTTGSTPIRTGKNGVADNGTGRTGDYRTPKGDFYIGGAPGGTQQAKISVSPNANNAVLNSRGQNMGAAFFGLTIQYNGKNRGIGIHGQGSNGLGTTAGCIKMKNDDLLLLAPYITAGIPIKIY